MPVPWFGGKPIFLDEEQIGEIYKDPNFGFVLRTLKPSGTVRVEFSSNDISDVRSWLDTEHKGWSKDRRFSTGERRKK